MRTSTSQLELKSPNWRKRMNLRNLRELVEGSPQGSFRLPPRQIFYVSLLAALVIGSQVLEWNWDVKAQEQTPQKIEQETPPKYQEYPKDLYPQFLV